MNKHTPGPWQVSEGYHQMPHDWSEATIYTGEPGQEYQVLAHVRCLGSESTTPEALANARVMAAAPELLAACERVAAAERCLAMLLDRSYPGWRQHYTFAEMFAEVGAAIAKARGGEEGSGDDPLGPPDEGGRELSPPEARWLDEEEARQDSL